MTDFTDDLAVETSNVKFKLADPLGRPIVALRYEVRQAGKILAQGTTDAEGDSTQFQALIGLPISIAVQRFMTSEMKVIREVTPWTAVFPIVLVSGKVLEKTETTEEEGAPGAYRRKTYLVQDGDTLQGVAAQQGCDQQELADLNEIAVDSDISASQVLKVPLPASVAGGGTPTPAPAGDGRDAAAAPASSDDEPAGDTDGASSDAPAAADATTAAPPAPVAAPPRAPPPAPHAAPVPAPHPHAAPAPAPAAHPAPRPAAPRPPAPAPAPGAVEIVMSKLESAWTSLVEEFRGATGSPKAVTSMKCPGVCLKVGDKGPLVEELNIRLSGFGGTIQKPAPLNEFTAATEAAVKQFQRDFMKVAETGKVCGALLAALDQFRDRYPINFAQTKCKCGRCPGFGTGQVDSTAADFFRDPPHNTKPYGGVEYPGMHRALMWAFRASLHYTQVTEKDLQYGFLAVSSAYRCWHDNKSHSRHTSNHMGNALDVQFRKGAATRRCDGADLDNLRARIFVKHLGAQLGWTLGNKVSLERTSDGATSWVHMDVRQYDDQYKASRHYAVTQAAFDGDSMVVIAKREGRLALTACAGLSPANVPVGPPAGAVAPRASGKAAARPAAAAKSAPARVAPASAPAAPSSHAVAETRMAIASLSISAAGLSFIRGFEHCKLQPYDDSQGFCTIGWGHLIERKSCAASKDDPEFQDFKDGIDQAEADRMFKKDVGSFETMVKSRVQVPMFQHEYDALVSLIFNMGSFQKCPKLLSKLNTKDYSGCCDEFADITNGGTAGLVTRRKAEMDIFRNSVYNSDH